MPRNDNLIREGQRSRVLIVAAFGLLMWLAPLRFARSGDDQLAAQPPLGHAVAIEVVDVIDGDTITVKIVLLSRVRLLDCWAPETRTGDEHEKRAGLRAKAALQQLAAGRKGVLFVPTSGAQRLGDVWSFDRVLGQVWLDGDRETLSAHQVGRRLASSTKGGKLGE
jgi:endonuclease YncB( thermonuclease family)